MNSKQEVPALVYSMGNTIGIGFLTDESNGYDSMIDIPFTIPIIGLTDSNKKDVFDTICSKKGSIFKSIVNTDMPDEMVSEIQDNTIEFPDTIKGTSTRQNKSYILFVGMDNRIYLVDEYTYDYSRLLGKDIFVIYVSDDTDDKHIHKISNMIAPYILNKKIVRRDTFNFKKNTRMPKETGILKILDYNLYKMVTSGYSSKNISYMIVYDNTPIDKLMRVEKVAQKLGRYYESIFVGDQRGFIYNIDSIDEDTLSASKVTLPIIGIDIIDISQL